MTSNKMMSLSDGLTVWEFDIVGDPPDINEEPQTPTSHIFGSAGKEFGDWEPGHSHIQQKTWLGGRGNQEFVDDERYWHVAHRPDNVRCIDHDAGARGPPESVETANPKT